MEQTSEQTALIEIKKLNYRYPQSAADLWKQDQTFTIYQGEIVGLAGENGSGKSTLLRLIAGFIPWTRECTGSIDRCHITDSEIAGVIERPSFFAELSVQDNIRMLERMNGKNARLDEELVDRLGIHEFDWTRASKLSLGNKQKLALGLALHKETRLALLDEPFNGLDPFAKAAFLSYMQEERSKGMTFVLTSHIKGDLDTVCDRIICL